MELRTALPVAVILGTVFGAAVVSVESGSRRGALIPAASVAVVELADVPVRWDLPVEWNASVERFVTLFSGEQADRMALYLKRSGRYEGMIRAKLRERGMPEDLVYLSMIESGFNPNARSRVQAVGLWQFMAPTARGYGLRVDSYVDERRDPEKSTDAALRYLQDLHGQFGSWNLAAAAYNSGGGRVSRVMRAATGADRGVEADFWRIRDKLPRDTREYVPLIFAAALVGKDPQRYGLGAVERYLPVLTDTVAVPARTRLATVAEAVGATEKELRSLNPQLLRGETPPGDAYPVRVPDGTAATLQGALPRLATEKAAAEPEVHRHRVARGESLGKIARDHGVSLSALRRANGLSSRSVIRTGQTLRIPS